MSHKFYFVVILILIFLLCISIKADDIDEDMKKIIECKLTKAENKLQLLPVSMSIKNISNKSISIYTEENVKFFMEIVSENSSGSASVSEGSLKNKKLTPIEPGLSMKFSFDLYPTLLKFTDLKDSFDSNIKLRVVAFGHGTKYDFTSEAFKLTNFFEEKLLKEIFTENNAVSLKLEIDDKGILNCRLINGYDTDKKFIKPSLNNIKFELSYLNNKGKSKTFAFGNDFLKMKLDTPESILIKQKESYKVSGIISAKELINKVLEFDNQLDKSKTFKLMIKYHEYKQGLDVYFLPLESNEIEYILTED